MRLSIMVTFPLFQSFRNMPVHTAVFIPHLRLSSVWDATNGFAMLGLAAITLDRTEGMEAPVIL